MLVEVGVADHLPRDESRRAAEFVAPVAIRAPGVEPVDAEAVADPPRRIGTDTDTVWLKRLPRPKARRGSPRLGGVASRSGDIDA
jgi:hypothetical protein